MSSNESNLRFRVYAFYRENINRGKSFTVRHFQNEEVPRSTIYSILQRFEDGLAPERKTGSGRIAKIFTPKKIKRLATMFDNSDRQSIRSAARKFNASSTMVHKVLRTKTTIRFRKKQSIPARTDNQIALARPKCRRLMQKFTNRMFILDDESYFTLSNTSLSGNDGFYSSDVASTSADVKFARKKKFEDKVLVWIAIGPKGLSLPLIRKSGFAINAKRYLDECIRRRLIPYIRANYSDGEYIFWPDQASAHYAKIVIDHLTAENIDFVRKEDNPANVPEIRPIENFWAYLKRLVYAQGWEAKTANQLITRIKYCLKKIDQDVVQTLALSTKRRIDGVRRHGLIENR